MFYLTEKDSLAFYKEDIFSTKLEEIDIDYICRTPKFIELRWMDLIKIKALLLKLSEAVSNITGEDIKSIEPLDVAVHWLRLRSDRTMGKKHSSSPKMLRRLDLYSKEQYSSSINI